MFLLLNKYSVIEQALHGADISNKVDYEKGDEKTSKSKCKSQWKLHHAFQPRCNFDIFI